MCYQVEYHTSNQGEKNTDTEEYMYRCEGVLLYKFGDLLKGDAVEIYREYGCKDSGYYSSDKVVDEVDSYRPAYAVFVKGLTKGDAGVYKKHTRKEGKNEKNEKFCYIQNRMGVTCLNELLENICCCLEYLGEHLTCRQYSYRQNCYDNSRQRDSYSSTCLDENMLCGSNRQGKGQISLSCKEVAVKTLDTYHKGKNKGNYDSRTVEEHGTAEDYVIGGGLCFKELNESA